MQNLNKPRTVITIRDHPFDIALDLIPLLWLTFVALWACAIIKQRLLGQNQQIFGGLALTFADFIGRIYRIIAGVVLVVAIAFSIVPAGLVVLFFIGVLTGDLKGL